MPKFSIEIEQVSISYTTVKIEAENRDEAVDVALSKAYDGHYERIFVGDTDEYDATYVKELLDED